MCGLRYVFLKSECSCNRNHVCHISSAPLEVDGIDIIQNPEIHIFILHQNSMIILKYYCMENSELYSSIKQNANQTDWRHSKYLSMT